MNSKGFRNAGKDGITEFLSLLDGVQGGRRMEAGDGGDARREEHLFGVGFAFDAGRAGGRIYIRVECEEEGVVVRKKAASRVYGKGGSGVNGYAAGNERKIDDGRGACCFASMRDMGGLAICVEEDEA